MKSTKQLQNELINLKAESTDLKEKLTEIDKAKSALNVFSGINFCFDDFDGDISTLEDKIEYWANLLSQRLEVNKKAMDSIISKLLCLSDETKCNEDC